MRRGPRLTPLGVGFCVAAAAALVAAATAEVPALLLVTSLLLGLVVAAAVYVRCVPVRVEVTRRIEPALLAARESGEIRTALRLTGRAGLWGTTWVERLPPALRAEASGRLPRLTSAHPAGEVSYTVTARRRGRHLVGPLELVVSDPFDLARRTVLVGEATELVVLPQQVDLGRDHTRAPPADGDRGLAQHRLGQGEDDVIARPYVDGDAMKRLHWKATARRGALMVRQEEAPDESRGLVLLDVAGAGHGADGLEWAVVAAASILAELSRARGVVDLRTSDGTVHRRVGSEHAPVADALLDLALVEEGPGGVVDVADAPAGTVVVLGSLDVEGARRWVRAVHRPAQALVGAATGPAALDVLDAAGWACVTYRPSDPWADVWARLMMAEVGDGHR